MVYPYTLKVQSSVKSGSKFGLNRTRALLDLLGSPDEKLKIIHIAGTNGKGSTAAYISSALGAAGKTFGTFTSPQVYCYNETFVINSRPAASELIEKYLMRTCKAAEALSDAPTSFELETAAALLMFAEEGCEYAVAECGLGGRDDATNAVRKKELAVITSVSLEHTAVLGNTVTEICRAKSGIIKNCPAVVSALQTAEGASFFRSLGVKFAGEGLKILSSSAEGQTFSLGGEIYSIRMTGSEQCYNAATAATACALLGLPNSAIKLGLERATLPGRNEIIRAGGVTYILDGSHNLASFSPVIQLVDSMEGKKVLVYGCLSDKDVEGAARALSGHFSSAVLFSPDSYRAMDIDKITDAFRGRMSFETAPTISAGLDMADGGIIAVCGSFTILKEAREWIEKRL